MPNLLANPRTWARKKIVLVDEATYGDDGLPTGAANWFEARNVSHQAFEAETAPRNLIEDWMDSEDDVITSIWSKLSFDIALAGSGVAGTAPKWGVAMLGCAFAETVSAGVNVTYNRVSELFGSLTAYMAIEGVLYKFIGARGNVKCKLSKAGIPLLSFEYSSLYTEPVAGTIAGIDKTGWTFEQAVNSQNTGKATLGGVDMAFESLEWDAGNQISRIDLPGPQLEVGIREQKSSAKLVVLQPPLATFNPWALAKARTVLPLTNTHGTVAGKKVKADLNVRITGVEETEVEGFAAYSLALKPRPVAGNDAIALTCL